MAETGETKPASNNGGGSISFDDRRFLPEEVWTELRSLLDPRNRFHGEYKLVIHDGRLVHTERLSRVRTLLKD